MTEQERSTRRLRHILIALGIGAILGVGACYLYFRLVPYFPILAPGCALSRITHIYCPGCGGTRATAALLRGDVAASLLANPIVVYLAAVGGFLYLRSWWWVAKRRPERVLIPAWSWLGLVVLALTVFVLRNVLMIFFGLDSLGENLPYWRG